MLRRLCIRSDRIGGHAVQTEVSSYPSPGGPTGKIPDARRRNRMPMRQRCVRRSISFGPARSCVAKESAELPTSGVVMLGPTAQGDRVVLAASLTTPPGEYTVRISAVSQKGEVRTMTLLDITLDPVLIALIIAATPPVALLNGSQSQVSPLRRHRWSSRAGLCLEISSVFQPRSARRCAQPADSGRRSVMLLSIPRPETNPLAPRNSAAIYL